MSVRAVRRGIAVRCPTQPSFPIPPVSVRAARRRIAVRCPTQTLIPPQWEIASGAAPSRNDKWPVSVCAVQAVK
ncbi:MAG: hypothetical protein KatS3mg054_0480 [Chloroflexus sp.]|nr:MAG: hypothetical protein KatS3mg054_0480 [Chloroflexus sp.]